MRSVWLALLGIVSAIGSAHALRDHQQCYLAKDPLALSGVIDIEGSLGVSFGCRLGKAVVYCDPAAKTVVSANVPVQPVSGRGLLDGRICYRLRCKRPYPAAAPVMDQFGTRTMTRLRPRLLCTPAVHGPPAPLMDNLDHLACYKGSDTVALKGKVDVDTLDVGTSNGCTITRSKLVCVPATTTVQSLSVSPELPILGTGLDDPRVCYAVKCARPYPGPQLVSDRFGSRTMKVLAPKLLCAPSPATTTSTTSTTIGGPTTTTTSTLPSPDDALNCQRAIEAGGMAYAREAINQLEVCMGPGGSGSPASCMNTGGPSIALNNLRTQWGNDTAAPCTGVDLRTTLGYPERCGVAPSGCTFTSPLRDQAGGSNDVLDCLACRIKEQLVTSATSMSGGQPATEPCREAISRGSLAVLEDTLDAAYGCVLASTVTSVASCWTPSFGAWRAQAASACSGVDPFGSLGYTHFCSGTPAATANSYAPHAFPCSFNMNTLDTTGYDNDVLDCATCEANEGALGVARDLFGANLCCIGGTCNSVLTRYACRRDGGTPARYRITTLTATGSGNAHGIATGSDGSLYLEHHFQGGVLRVTPGGTVTTVANTPGFRRGVAVDTAGNVYTADGCSHTITKYVAGVGTVIAGIPNSAGSTGDGGPATSAKTVMPDGIDVDAAGNVYFTESGLLGFLCGGPIAASERVRMIDTSGNIHTVAGGGTNPPGGPAVGALLSMPYGLRLAYDGSLLIGEVIGMRALRLRSGMLEHVAGVLLMSPIGSHSGFGGPALNARFYENCGISGDPDGNVIIAMMEDNRVALVDTGGSVITIGGTGEGPGGAAGLGDDQPATLERINTPEDVAVAPDGTIYVSDLGNGTIRILRREAF